MITAIFDAIQLLELRVLESANSVEALLSCQCNDLLGTRIEVPDVRQQPGYQRRDNIDQHWEIHAPVITIKARNPVDSNILGACKVRLGP